MTIETTAPALCYRAANLMRVRGAERDNEGERSMARTVEAFNTMTGHSLTEEEGWQFMVFLKMARMQGGCFKRDDYEDCIAYSALQGEAAINQQVAAEAELEGESMSGHKLPEGVTERELTVEELAYLDPYLGDGQDD